MMLRKLIKSGIDHFHIISVDRFLNIGNFLGTLIDQQDQHMHLGIAAQNRFSHFLQQRCLTCLGRGYDHTTLSLTDGTHQIHNSHGNAAAGSLHFDPLIGEDRSHIFECHSLGGFFYGISVNALNKQKRTELLLLGLDPLVTLQNITGLQSETADLTGCHIDIILTGHIILATDKSIAIRHDFQNTAGFDTAVQFLGILTLIICHIIGIESTFFGVGFAPHAYVLRTLPTIIAIRSVIPLLSDRTFRSLLLLRFFASDGLCRRLLLLLCRFSLFLFFQPLILCQHSFYQLCFFHRRSTLQTAYFCQFF